LVAGGEGGRGEDGEAATASDEAAGDGGASARGSEEPAVGGEGAAPDPRGSGVALRWRSLDVGSPFDYQRQAIAYIAKHLPRPGRDGIGEAALAEIGDLAEASGGRALGLFSSLRAAQAAAAWVRASRGLPVLCQGEGHLAGLVRRFLDEPETSLFGTISLWQGVDAPGATCHLVVIDRLPFPRPDEPLSQARQEAVARGGGNGFMAVAAAHAALLLAQGAGRLIRGPADRGVVAILDPRLATAGYGPFLVRSLPPFWLTADRATVLAALRRLSAEAGPPPISPADGRDMSH
jgi:ATP-dependent DNA helicase DinG